MIILDVFKYSLLACCLWCIYRGGRPERLGAAMLIGDFAARSVMKTFGHTIDFTSVDNAYLVLTVVFFLLSLAIALKSNRLWPLFFSAFFLVQLTGHLAVIILSSGGKLGILGYDPGPHHRADRGSGDRHAGVSCTCKSRNSCTGLAIIQNEDQNVIRPPVVASQAGK